VPPQTTQEAAQENQKKRKRGRPVKNMKNTQKGKGNSRM